MLTGSIPDLNKLGTEILEPHLPITIRPTLEILQSNVLFSVIQIIHEIEKIVIKIDDEIVDEVEVDEMKSQILLLRQKKKNVLDYQVMHTGTTVNLHKLRTEILEFHLLMKSQILAIIT